MKRKINMIALSRNELKRTKGSASCSSGSSGLNNAGMATVGSGGGESCTVGCHYANEGGASYVNGASSNSAG